MATNYGFYINTDICIGCKACMTSCMDRNNLDAPYKFRKVWEFGDGDWQDDGNGAFTTTAFTYYVSLTCNQCDEPACVANCPTGAMTKDEATGIVNNDKDVCIGCGTCTTSCPYHHPVVFKDRKSHKCVLCTDQSPNHEPEPVCANACPVRALVFGKVDTLRGHENTSDEVPGLPATTKPNVVIGLHRDVSKGGILLNPQEVTS
jgi:anaerobic dimethyl sulfoxide reductase subunit B (iron-sulfur subunit)